MPSSCTLRPIDRNERRANEIAALRTGGVEEREAHTMAMALATHVAAVAIYPDRSANESSDGKIKRAVDPTCPAVDHTGGDRGVNFCFWRLA